MLDWVANKIWGTDPLERQIGLEQVVLAAQNSRLAIYAMPFSLLGMAAVSAQWNDGISTAIWAICSLSAVLVMAVAFRTINGFKDDISKLPICAGILMAGNVAVQATLISGALAFWVPNSAESHLFWMLTLAVCQATAMAVLAPCLPVSLTTGLLGLTASSLALSQGSVTYDIIGAMGLLLIFALAGIALSLNRTATSMLRLRRDQGVLIERLTTANQAKSDFLANMSHELRTPLNAILGFSEIMRDEMMGPLGAKPYKEYSRDIHSSGTHLLSLINDILDLAKIDAGKYELRESDVDLNGVIDEAIRMIAPRAAEGDVTIVNEVPHNLVIRVDATALKQIALNVGMNAVKFTPAGGAVRVYGTILPDGRFAVAVRDTGCGIRAEDLESVFENFGQGRHDVAVREKGTGLGLPIVRSLMRAHGGDAILVSKPGEGTTVYLTLPSERVISLGGAADLLQATPRAA